MTEVARRRRLWPRSLAGKAGVVALGVLGALASAYGAATYFTSKRLAEARQHAEQHGFTNDLGALLGPFLPPEKNAAVPLDQAVAAADRCWTAARQKHKIPET